jgi:uncharacterized Fe-S cluster-containing radical SAM superfamily protein
MTKHPLSFEIKSGDSQSISNVDDLFGFQLRDLLDLLIPVSEGDDVNIDAFRLLNSRGELQSIAASFKRDTDKADPLALYEPRIEYIQRVLTSLLDLVTLESNGKSVDIDGFRLKDPRQWLSPSGGVSDILAQAASRCNLNCRFCYNKASPPGLRISEFTTGSDVEDIATRIQHYVPQRKLNLFPNMGSPSEALTHPRIWQILQELRDKTRELIRIPTNGSLLTPETVRRLKDLQPIYLDISINSSSPERRKWLMRDPAPEIALDSLKLLQTAGIPYSIVIVPWPFPSIDAMVADLETTIRFVSEHEPTMIQVSLPGYTKESAVEETFSTDEVWNIIKQQCLKLRDRFDCPLVIRPGLFEDYLNPDRIKRPIVLGTVRNSPARRGGLRVGDHILEVNGIPTKSRTQALSLLTTLHHSELTEAALKINRNEEILNLQLMLTEYGSPYTPGSATHLGMVFSTTGIPGDWLESLQQVLHDHKTKEVLLFTSSLVFPYLKAEITRNGYINQKQLHLRVPDNTYFGGNIMMGDLLVVSDFVQAIEKFKKEVDTGPDLVIIPSSPFHMSRWGRDLTGQVYLEIERQTGIPVTLIECEPIFD